jgi:hypothetical protein
LIGSGAAPRHGPAVSEAGIGVERRPRPARTQHADIAPSDAQRADRAPIARAGHGLQSRGAGSHRRRHTLTSYLVLGRGPNALRPNGVGSAAEGGASDQGAPGPPTKEPQDEVHTGCERDAPGALPWSRTRWPAPTGGWRCASESRLGPGWRLPGAVLADALHRVSSMRGRSRVGWRFPGFCESAWIHHSQPARHLGAGEFLRGV